MPAVIARPSEDIFQGQKSFPEIRDALTKYLRAARKSISDKDRMEASLQIAVCEAIIGNIKESEELLTACEAYILAHGRDEDKAALHHTRLRLLIHHSRFAEALAEGLKALYLFQQLPYPYFTMTTCTCCGVACSNLNLFTEAIDYISRAHTTAIEMGDRKDALLCMANLNEVRMRIMPVDECIAYNLAMLDDIREEYGSRPSTVEAGTCLHLAHLYTLARDYSTAERYADRSLSVVRQFSYLPPYHFLYTNLFAVKADIAGSRGQEQEMLRYAEECLSRAREVGKTSPEIDIRFILFRYYIAQQDPTRARTHLDRAEALIPTTDRGAPYLDLMENKCLYYQATGDTAAELAAFRLVHESKLKIQQESLGNRVKYLSAVHELEMRKIEIEQHKAEIALKTQELNMTTYHLQKRNQLLTDLKTNITDLKKEKHKSDVVFRTITRTIDQAFGREEVEKAGFREKFDEAHRSFISRLHQLHPTLSPTECRLCALLRSGFNTKEISSLLSTSIRNVENHRVSIRRKMNLSREDNLNLVLTSIE